MVRAIFPKTPQSTCHAHLNSSPPRTAIRKEKQLFCVVLKPPGFLVLTPEPCFRDWCSLAESWPDDLGLFRREKHPMCPNWWLGSHTRG